MWVRRAAARLHMQSVVSARMLKSFTNDVSNVQWVASRVVSRERKLHGVDDAYMNSIVPGTQLL